MSLRPELQEEEVSERELVSVPLRGLMSLRPNRVCSHTSNRGVSVPLRGLMSLRPGDCLVATKFFEEFQSPYED